MLNKRAGMSRHLARRQLAVAGLAAVADLKPGAAECGQVLTDELLMVPDVGHSIQTVIKVEPDGVRERALATVPGWPCGS